MVKDGFQPDTACGSSGLVAELLHPGRSRLVHSGRLLVQTKEAKSPSQSLALLLGDSLLFLQELPGCRYAPLISPGRHLPLIRFAETDVIVREHESGKARGATSAFFLIVKRPDPTLISLACHSQEDRAKWLRLINQVRDSNPLADERALEAERQLRRKAAASADLLSAMERRDRDLLALMNEKGQLWQQLLRLWGCQEVSGEDTADSSVPEPERVSREAMSELAHLRRLLRCFRSGGSAATLVGEGETEGSTAADDEDAAAASLKRSSSSAEEKSAAAAAAAVNLPKRADTFSGYDNNSVRRSTRKLQQQQQQQQQQQLVSQPLPPQQQQLVDSGTVTLREKEREGKTRRPSMFEIFRRPARESVTSSTLAEDPAIFADVQDTIAEVAEASPPPDSETLETLGRLQALVTAMSAALLRERSRLAGRVQTEAELRQEISGLRSSRELDTFRSQDSILEMIRIQRAELDHDRTRFRDECLREKARLETRAEELERREEQVRQRLEEVDRQEKNLQDQQQVLKLQSDRLEKFLATLPDAVEAVEAVPRSNTANEEPVSGNPAENRQPTTAAMTTNLLSLKARAASAAATAAAVGGSGRRNGEAAGALHHRHQKQQLQQTMG